MSILGGPGRPSWQSRPMTWIGIGICGLALRDLDGMAMVRLLTALVAVLCALLAILVVVRRRA